jgi:hypothetical protein
LVGLILKAQRSAEDIEIGPTRGPIIFLGPEHIIEVKADAILTKAEAVPGNRTVLRGVGPFGFD